MDGQDPNDRSLPKKRSVPKNFVQAFVNLFVNAGYAIDPSAEATGHGAVIGNKKQAEQEKGRPSLRCNSSLAFFTNGSLKTCQVMFVSFSPRELNQP